MSVATSAPLKSSEILKQAQQDCLKIEELLEVAWADRDVQFVHLESLEDEVRQLEQQLEKLDSKRGDLEEERSLQACAGDAGPSGLLLTRLLDYRTEVSCDLADATLEAHQAEADYREAYNKTDDFLRQLDHADERLLEIIRTIACPCK
jgi:vacuolar-type H+-ATPase subunit I/STV1